MRAAETKDYAAADLYKNGNNNNVGAADADTDTGVDEYKNEKATEGYSSSLSTPRPHAAAGKRRVDGTRLNDGVLCRLGKP